MSWCQDEDSPSCLHLMATYEDEKQLILIFDEVFESLLPEDPSETSSSLQKIPLFEVCNALVRTTAHLALNNALEIGIPFSSFLIAQRGGKLSLRIWDIIGTIKPVPTIESNQVELARLCKLSEQLAHL